MNLPNHHSGGPRYELNAGKNWYIYMRDIWATLIHFLQSPEVPQLNKKYNCYIITVMLKLTYRQSFQKAAGCYRSKGFTLAELLIALSILGVIATFTIPKVLVAQRDFTYKANAKDVAAMLAGAYTQLKLNGDLSSSTTIGDLTPFMNYVRVYTGSIDDTYTDTIFNCGTTYHCLQLHNGGVIAYRSAAAFGGTATTNGLPFCFDPDGKVTDGTTNGPGKSLCLFLYYDGRIVDRANIPAGTSNTVATYGAMPNKTPPWFSWD